MFEKVNPKHPDKIADRIGGAIVDLAYAVEENPKIAVEVLIGHDACHIIIETSVFLDGDKVASIVNRIAGPIKEIDIKQVHQDEHLASNQKDGPKCGDNGIFKGMPVTEEQQKLTDIAAAIYDVYKDDGKYILADNKLIICQSNAPTAVLKETFPDAIVNPLGEWTGGTDVDTGAGNRKLGSDMGDAVSGGGIHLKDASKADVSVNIYAHLKAQETGKPVELFCAIGDDTVDGKPYEEIVKIALDYIKSLGGFEKFAEWGLIRPSK